MRIARFLVQGVDVWLNNPRRPLEASGTSRDEGRGQRRPQRQRARRLVGRGLDAATTAGRSAAARPTRDEGAQDWADARTCTGSWRRRSSRATTSATPRPAARWVELMRSRSPERSGASRRHGCSTNTSSGCTCRRPASSRRPPAADRRGPPGGGRPANAPEPGPTRRLVAARISLALTMHNHQPVGNFG